MFRASLFEHEDEKLESPRTLGKPADPYVLIPYFWLIFARFYLDKATKFLGSSSREFPYPAKRREEEWPKGMDELTRTHGKARVFRE